MTAAPDSPASRQDASSVLLVGALQPHAGKTALASAIAVTLAYAGRRVLALRLANEGEDAGAEADARYFQTLPAARGRGGAPLSLPDAMTIAREQAQTGDLLLLEAPAGVDLAALTQEAGANLIVALRSADAEVMKSLGELADTLGDHLLGVLAIAAPLGLVEQARKALMVGPAPLLGVIPEDPMLYAPSVLEIVEALDAEVILGEPEESDIIEHLMIGPITTDPGQPYYARPRSRRAVITRSDKTDLQLAAMHTDIDCLILTGGVEPSPYTIDRAAGDEITVLLTKTDTRGAVSRLEDIFLTTRFASEEKLERMRALLDEHFDWGPLHAALAVPA